MQFQEFFKSTTHEREHMRKLASAVAKREGKRSETSIGNVRETLSVLVLVLAEDRASDLANPTPLYSEFNKALEKATAKAMKKAAKAQK